MASRCPFEQLRITALSNRFVTLTAVGTAVRLIVGLVAGALVGAFGTAIHRSIWGGIPVGLVVALLLTLSAGLFLRSAAGFTTFAAYGIGWLLTVWLLWIPNHGGDMLFVDHRESIPWAAASLIWMIVGPAFLVTVALLPPRWFSPPSYRRTNMMPVPPGAILNAPESLAFPPSNGTMPPDSFVIPHGSADG